MTRYFHKKTGAVIDTDCSPLGDWIAEGEVVQQKDSIKEPETEEKIVEPTKEENTADFDGVTRSQIMQELDAFGIEYDKRANKQTLYDLMMSQGK